MLWIVEATSAAITTRRSSHQGAAEVGEQVLVVGPETVDPMTASRREVAIERVREQERPEADEQRREGQQQEAGADQTRVEHGATLRDRNSRRPGES